MSKHHRKGRPEEDYVDEEEIATSVRDERLLIDEEPTGTDDSGYDNVNILQKGQLEDNDATNNNSTGVRLSGTKQRGSNKKRQQNATDPLGYYKVMGVSPTADAFAIRRAFLALSSTYHSDKHSQQDELAQGYMNERFQQLSEAYEVLSDPRRRAAYDHSGSLGIARLELVPLSAVNPTDVKKYLSLLQAEAQLKKAERLLSSSSSATIHISAAHHFSSYKALGLMKGVDDEDDAGDDNDDDAAASQQGGRRLGRPNISAFAAKGKAESEESSDSGNENDLPNGSSANSLSSSSASVGDAANEKTMPEGNDASPPDDLTAEEKAFLEEQIAYQKHMERETAEKQRLLSALQRAPPRWDPSQRGIGPYLHQQAQPLPSAHDTAAPAAGQAQREEQKQEGNADRQQHNEAAQGVSSNIISGSSATETAAAAVTEQNVPKNESSGTEDKSESTPAKAIAKESHQPSHHVSSNVQGGAPPSPHQPGTPQASAQLAEVMINGKPTLVAILPAHVAAQLRAQMGGGGGVGMGGEGSSDAGNTAAVAGEGGAPMISDTEATAMDKMNPKERKAHHKGILRKVATAKAQQALREMPLAVLLSLDFIHMYNYPIGDRTNITFRASAKKNIDASAGSDGANVGISLEHVLSPLSKIRLNLKATFNLLKLQFSHTRVLSAASTFTNKVTLYAGGYFLRDFSMSLTRRLSAALSMTNTLALSASRSGGSFSTAAQYVLSSHSMVAGSVDMGFGSLACSANYVAKLTKKVKASVALRSSLLGGSTECSYELWYARNQLEQVGVGAAVAIPYSYNFITGVTSSPQPVRLTQFFILLARGDHSIRIPIVVVVNDHVAKLLLFGSIPALTVSIARVLSRPFSNLHKAKAYQRARSLHVKNVAAARRRAQVEMLALHSFVLKKRANEETVIGGGLVILEATYGVLHPEVAVLPPLADVVETLVSPLSSTSSPLPVPRSSAFTEIGVQDPDAEDPNTFSLAVDVTSALQSLVHSSSLVLAEGNKDSLPGFFDVDPGTKERRYISVKYLFKKRLHKVEIDAEEALTLPMEDHVDLSGA